MNPYRSQPISKQETNKDWWQRELDEIAQEQKVTKLFTVDGQFSEFGLWYVWDDELGDYVQHIEIRTRWGITTIPRPPGWRLDF